MEKEALVKLIEFLEKIGYTLTGHRVDENDLQIYAVKIQEKN
jgi:hypothetical protein